MQALCTAVKWWMESQLERPHPQDGGLRSSVEDEDAGQDHEKNSVLKKVKAKAKKLKETIAKHAHVHEHGHDRGDASPDDHDLEEEDDDEETVTDPEVHGAPIYESEAFVAGVGPRSSEHGKVENPREEVVPAPANSPGTPPHSMSTAPGINRVPDCTIENFVGPFRAEEDQHSPTRRDDPPNYNSKSSDPAGLGSQQADVSQLIQSTRKMAIVSEPESRMEQDRILTTGTGSHDQFLPESVVESEHSEDIGEKPSQRGYTEKIVSATAAIADKATLAKDIIASKLGFADKDRPNPEISEKDHTIATARGEETSNRLPTKGITAALTEKLSPVYNKVVEMGSTVVSKVRDGRATGGKTDKSSGGVGAAKSQDKGVSVKNYLAEKLKPGEEDKALSEMISDALHKRKKEAAVEQSPQP